MSRISIDTRPSIIVRPHLARVATLAEVEDVANAVADLVRISVLPRLWQVPGLNSDQCAIEIKLEDDFRCRHCNSSWIGEPADFNCGCAQDEANDPERLASVRQAAHDLQGVAFYAIGEDGRHSDVPVSWPNTLASMAINWLDAGRPDAWASLLLFGIKRVRDGEWRSLRKPLSPFVLAFTGRLDGVRDRRPDDLACALLELMDDMGLLTATGGASDAP